MKNDIVSAVVLIVCWLLGIAIVTIATVVEHS